MGVLAAYRGKGIGRNLLRSAISAARDVGITRIELEVFASNTVARRLYESAGFVEEGIKRNARIIDGKADDHISMALFL
jgi:RimJ/RimL family protein N-acetyltransferase